MIDIKVYECPYPFIRDTYATYDECGPDAREVWNPGVRFNNDSAEADGAGKLILEVVSTHKPGRYPERVFMFANGKTLTERYLEKESYG